MLIFNIIITLLLINTLFSRNSNILGCGVFGFMSNSINKMNWDKFNILGIFNDPRGGDSCGRVTEWTVEYGLHIESDYKDFAAKYKNPEGKYKTIIGHTRKASVGGVNKENAQPIIFHTNSKEVKRRRKKNPTLDKFITDANGKDRVVFTGAHNGTITNYKELAKKYQIKVEGKSDSIILLEIIFKHGFDVLKDYKGTAAIIIYDFVDNSGYVFHGKSPVYNRNAYAVDERPLYFWQESVNTLYFSSLEESLKFIGGSKDTVKELEYNVLYKIKGGKFVEEVKYDRAYVPQKETVTTSTVNRTSNARDWNNWNAERYMDGYDDVDYGYNDSHVSAKALVSGFNINEKLIEGSHNIMNEVYPASTGSNSVSFCKGRYWLKDNLTRGVLYLNKAGFVVDPASPDVKPYFFIDGVMIIGRKQYEEALTFVKQFSINSQEYTKKLAKLSRFPVHPYSTLTAAYGDFYNPYSEGNKEYSTYLLYDGAFRPLFSNRTYIINKGTLLGIAECTQYQLANHDDVDKNIPNKKAIPLSQGSEAMKTLSNFKKIKEILPCDDCDLKTCYGCDELDSVLDAFTENRKNNKTKKPKSIVEAVVDAEAELFEQEENLYEEDYMDMYKNQIKKITDSGVDQMDDLLSELAEIGNSEYSSKLELLLQEVKNTFYNFKTEIE